MNDFYKALAYANERLYKPNHLIVREIKEERQNAEYGAEVFQLNETSVRFRVAKKTPTKIGQFVAFWEKNEKNKNQAFSYENAPDVLVITIFSENKFGQFVFPKEVLLKQHILRTVDKKGKMAIRVYPSWETPTSKQAINTQKWQLDYFVELTDENSSYIQKLLNLYDR